MDIKKYKQKRIDTRHRHQLPSFLRVRTGQIDTSHQARFLEGLIKQLNYGAFQTCAKATMLGKVSSRVTVTKSGITNFMTFCNRLTLC
jgi:hypothetical protein